MPFDKCPKNNNCRINCFLITDTNSIFYLVQALINDIEINHTQLGRNSKFILFSQKISGILEKFSHCSLNNIINISEAVFDYEISPIKKINNRNSTLRRKMSDFNTMCSHLNRNFGKIEDIFRNYINIEIVNNEELNEFREFFPIQIRPIDRDASLLLFGLKKANNECETLILTDDNHIEKAYKYLISHPHISLSSGQLNPERLYTLNYFNFLTTLTDCCQICAEEYVVLYNQYIASWEIRRREVGTNFQRTIQTFINLYTAKYLVSLRKKISANA